jgi:hypothetical protein
MAEKKFLSWLGFKDEDKTSLSTPTHSAEDSHLKGTTASGSSGNSGTFERIRQLESELADLRARRDITSLTREEFEILATETAMSLIKTAQTREAGAVAAAGRSIAEAQRLVKQLTESAESKARSALQSAEGRGRKYLEAAELEAKEAIDKATKAAREHFDTKQREATIITATAKREAERVIGEATGNIANYKNWLNEAVAESERLHKIQAHALSAAEEGMRQSRAKISAAFERLSALGSEIENALTEDHRPKEKEFIRPIPKVAEKSTVKKAATPPKSVGKPPKRN